MKKFPKIRKKSEKFGTKLVNSLKIVGKGWEKNWTESTTKSWGCWAGTSLCPGRALGARGGPPGAVSGSKGGPQGPNSTPGGVPYPVAWPSPTSPGMPRPCPWRAAPCHALSWACLALAMPGHAMPCLALGMPRHPLSLPSLVLGMPRHALSLSSDPSFAQSAQGPLKSVKSASPPPRPCALCPVKDYNAREGARAVTHVRSSCSGLGRGIDTMGAVTALSQSPSL
jgi:hypothetical protein